MNRPMQTKRFPTSPFRSACPAGLIAVVMACGISHAAMTPDSKTQEWPANPARHQVVIETYARNDAEKRLIAIAEAAVVPKEELARAFAEEPANKDKQPPTDKNAWWYAEKMDVRIPYAVTGAAVEYYKGLVTKWSKTKMTRYIEPNSKLLYMASVRHEDTFKLGDKVFDKVDVVNLKVEFSANFTTEGTMGLQFTKTRQVVIDATGKVVAVSGDGKTEALMIAI